MRRRRRLNTQTISRKQPTTVLRPARIESRSFNFGKFVFYLFLIVVIGYGGYWVYTHRGQLFFTSTDTAFTDLSEVGKDEQPRLSDNSEAEQEKEKLPVYTPIQRKVQLEVLNGCGVKGIAKLLTGRLKKHDYDVVNSGNYMERGKENFYVAHSRLIDRLNTSENLANTRDLAEIIGIELGRIESQEDAAPVADISIIIGRDYKTLKIFK